MQNQSGIVIEEQEEEQSYVEETSRPLRTLYSLLLDIYENAYPIPFITFRKTFDKYMKATKKNIIDAIVLLIYGAKNITHIGTGDESISIDRIRGETNFSEDIKEVKSPFFRFISGGDEIRIGYDYSVVIDYIDSEEVNMKQSIEDVEKLIEGEDPIKNKTIPRFFIMIDPSETTLQFEYPEGRFNKIDIKNTSFVTHLTGEKYDLSEAKEISLQPVPDGCVGVKSYLLESERTYVTELEDGNQFCYDTRYARFDLIHEDGTIIRNYIV